MNKVVAHLSKKGRGGDKTIGHLTPGEIVIPKSAQTPDLLAHAKQTLGHRFGRYQVGGKDDSVNPKTGAKEFDDEDSAGNNMSDNNNIGGGGPDAGNYSGGNQSDNPFAPGTTYGPNIDDRGWAPNFNGWTPAERAEFEAQNQGTKDQSMTAAQQEADFQNAQRNLVERFFNINYTADPGAIGYGTTQQNMRVDPVGFAASLAGGPLAGLAVRGARNFVPGLETPGTFNIPMPGPTPTSGLEEQSPTDENYGSSNLDAIRQFLGGGPAPEFNPVAAARALTNAMNGISSATEARHVTGKGYEQPAYDKVQSIFDSFSGSSDYDTMLNDSIGQSFANNAFDTKQGELRNQYAGDVNKAFPEGGDLFSPEEFGSAVDNFLNGKFNEASAQVGRFASRGNLSASGVGIAQNNLNSQRDAARTKVDAAGHSVMDADAPKFTGIRDKALGAANNYTLGGDDFSLDPFTTERQTTSDAEKGSFSSEVGSLLGSQNLFDVGGALNTAGAQQGQVSGSGSSNGVLDQLERRNTNKGRTRGVGTSGSGVF